MSVLSNLVSTRIRDAADPAKVVEVVESAEPISSSKAGLLSWVPGISDLIALMSLRDSNWHYGVVPAEETEYVLQTTEGAEGDFISHLTIQPLSETPGDVYLINGDNAPELIYDGSLMPVGVPIDRYIWARSDGGPWAVTTGLDVKVSWSGIVS